MALIARIKNYGAPTYNDDGPEIIPAPEPLDYDY